jgi:hypothetical protein
MHVRAVLAFLVLLSGATQAQEFDFRLSPGPRLVGTRADSSGSGRVHAELVGSTLVLKGNYQGLLGTPTQVHLAMGSLPGVRGPVIAPLTAQDGSLSGSIKLTSAQLSAFHKGGLYVEIDSAEAPDGDLWGWVMQPAQ